jgi:alpha-beta hydrolase superfamily lysophospholipase
MHVRTAWVVVCVFCLAVGRAATAQATVSFPTADGGLLYADLYGSGERAVVLAHGGQFNKESWKKQAEVLQADGFKVLAIDFRGYGQSRGPGDKDPMDAPLAEDVLAAVRYLRAHGAKRVSVVGGSMGGAAAADASIVSHSGEIDSVVMLGAAPNLPADRMKSAALFIVAREDTSGSGPRLPGIKKQYERAPEPKKLVILEGSAHAQYLFQTDQAGRVMAEIVAWLEKRN